ncbi:hypothetical protein LguiA_018936 [Lonicera macranthoides]
MFASADSLLVEALSFREALSWIKQLGLTNVCVEMDSRLLIDALKGKTSNLSYFGSIVKDCLVLASGLFYFPFAYVHRSAN